MSFQSGIWALHTIAPKTYSCLQRKEVARNEIPFGKMRTALHKIDNQRMRFTGTFERYGRKTNFKGWPEVTILLVDIKDQNGKKVTDHLWFSYTKGIQTLGNLREGDQIEFHARVREYVKGYKGYRKDAMMENPPRLDYKLSHPTRFRIVKKGKENNSLLRALLKNTERGKMNQEQKEILNKIESMKNVVFDDGTTFRKLISKAICDNIDFDKAYHILANYWDSIPDNEKPKVHKELKRCGL